MHGLVMQPYYDITVNAFRKIIAVQEEGLGADLVQGLLLVRMLYLWPLMP